MATAPLVLAGAPGSPYSRKMRAVVRYRRIPHRWLVRGGPGDRSLPPVKVALIPVLVFPGEGGAPDEAMIDSTFQIRRLEAMFPERQVVPPDPVVALLDALIEDFGDEWLTKAMFHYRWWFDADIQNAGAILPRWRAITAPDAAVAPMSKMIIERQVGRLGVVGSNETTASVIEQSYRAFLRALDAHLASGHPYVMGNRPGASDFALFGQLTQLALFDPTPVAVTREEAPRIIAWCELIEDLSGIEVGEADWLSRDALPETIRGLLAVVGEYYAPFLVANAAALASGAEQVDCTIAGARWLQDPFPYQGKCLGWLRDAYAELSTDDRGAFDTVLAGTGCEVVFDA